MAQQEILDILNNAEQTLRSTRKLSAFDSATIIRRFLLIQPFVLLHDWLLSIQGKTGIDRMDQAIQENISKRDELDIIGHLRKFSSQVGIEESTQLTVPEYIEEIRGKIERLYLTQESTFVKGFCLCALVEHFLFVIIDDIKKRLP